MILLRWKRRVEHEFSTAHWVRHGRETDTLCGGRVPESVFAERLNHMEFYGRRCRGCQEVVADIGRRLHQYVIMEGHAPGVKGDE